jgi:hypothetical protein
MQVAFQTSQREVLSIGSPAMTNSNYVIYLMNEKSVSS